jgi:uncharacterized membrane protein (UPF0182 family)
VTTIDWPPPRPRRRRGRLFFFAVLAAVLLGGGTVLSFYIESLWFDSLGFSQVFWKTLNIEAAVFAVFFTATFLLLYGSFLLLKPSRLAELTSPILINGQPLRLPVEPVLRLIGGAIAIVIAGVTGLGMMGEWTTFALYWYGRGTATAGSVDPIFGRSIVFYLFTLPAWQLLVGWLTTIAIVVCFAAVFFAVVSGGTRLLMRTSKGTAMSLRGVSISFAGVLLAFAAQVYLGRFERLLTDHTIFAGVTYTDANVAIPGALLVVGALLLGAVILAVNAVSAPKLGLIVASVVPTIVVYLGVSVVGWYVNGFIVKPNELVREGPFIAHNIEMTRQAFALNRIQQIPFPAETSVAAVDADNNQETLENIRLWDWRALQDTLRQIQEIRTYYDFPDIDIDRYEVNGVVRQMMLAVRELNIDRLPESSRNWINEKLVYTHGYGVTMNRVNGFTPEGLPDLLLGNMPVQSSVPTLKVTRPEVYFGELTNTDVYVRTRQKEFNYPQGETNNETSYEGTGGITLGSFFRRLVVAVDRGDVTKMPFSDDITGESRLLMRRNIRDRVDALAPFLTFDPDPYIIVTAEGRLVWMMDGFTTSAAYPYARHYRLENQRVNYVRNSIKATIDAYDGTVTFYVFDSEDPIIAGYRTMFPTLFKDASEMSADLHRHVRYPELMLDLQAGVYGLYHMSAPDVFYNREDLWTVASEVGLTERREQAAQTMEPNFVLMKLPGERATEFIEILPFTPANRNNLIGWIAGRSDDPNYGTAIVYNFPKTKLVDGPLQIEARIDQNAQLSGQLSLWNQQGSHVRRGNLIVIPVGRALLYAEPIYLQAERSPMPELRIVVLALQDKLAYGPNFETAMAALFGNQQSTLTATTSQPAAARVAPQVSPPSIPGDVNGLIAEAAHDLAEYQRLTAEGKLGEAGQRLEALKEKLERLAAQRR